MWSEGKEETKQGIHALSKHRNSGARHLERSRLPAHNITAAQPGQPVRWLCRDMNMTQNTPRCPYLYALSATSESVMDMKLGHWVMSMENIYIREEFMCIGVR